MNKVIRNFGVKGKRINKVKLVRFIRRVNEKDIENKVGIHAEIIKRF